MPTVTIPTKNNINRNSGSLVLRVSHTADLLTKEILLTAGDFILAYESGFVTLEANGQSLTVPIALFPGQADILWTWIDNNHRLLVTDDAQGIESASHETGQMTGTFGDILVLSNTPAFTGSYQALLTYAKDYLYGDASIYRKNEFLEQADMLFHADYTQPMHYQTEPVIETTFAPEDGSPILVSDQNGLLNRQYFFDYTTGRYVPHNTEHFVYRGEDTLALAYGDLNPAFDTLVAFDDGESFLVVFSSASVPPEGARITLADDTLTFWFDPTEKERYHGQGFTVTYQLNRSYNVDYNDQTAHDSLRINLNHHQDHPIQVLQEGNRFSNQRLTREIDLNPLVNPKHTGFLYIDTEPQTTQAFRLNISQAYVVADGMDTADFMVEAIDAQGNEVLSPYLDVFLMDGAGRRTDELGRLSPVVTYDTLKARNMAGRCYYQYHAPLITTTDYALTQKLYVVAQDRRTGLGAQASLFIRPAQNAPVARPVRQQMPPAAALVFEYIARYLNRQLPVGHPLHQLDANADGILTRQDFSYFERIKYNTALMQELHHALRTEEG